MFLEQQIRILERFLKDHETMKSGVMASENSVLTSQEYILHLHFKIY